MKYQITCCSTIDINTDFIEKNKSYYITQNIEVSPGSSYVAVFNINLDLYKNATLDQSVLDILKKYEYQFGVNFVGDTLNEIKSLITKISEVKNVNTIDIQYFTPGKAQEISYDEIKDSIDVSYFEIECNITSTIKS
ncbi:MAG: hypothetical protein HUJ56_13430 [Erysipelotrichaceae bacterium]|nr:hypothetical protein [Erysipelotrichaceae bacterium]